MSQLSAQSIRELCTLASECQPMISPFSEERHVVNGKSWGLSAASYDVRIAHDLVLGPNPGFYLHEAMTKVIALSFLDMWKFRNDLLDLPPPNALANTVENFAIPDNVCGYVVDKSSYARVFVTAFNTLLDPGWKGNLTLELVNLGPNPIEIKKGDPIVQIAFHWLDRPTDRPYNGKYNNQPNRPVPAIYEGN